MTCRLQVTNISDVSTNMHLSESIRITLDLTDGNRHGCSRQRGRASHSSSHLPRLMMPSPFRNQLKEF
jgi:hypothetical protein